MQVQLFKDRAELLGDKVLKLEMTAVLADNGGAAVPNRKIRFKLDDQIVAEATTNENGEAKTGNVLVELPANHGHVIVAIPEGMVIRGCLDIGDSLRAVAKELPIQSISADSGKRLFTNLTASNIGLPPKYKVPQGLQPNSWCRICDYALSAGVVLIPLLFVLLAVYYNCNYNERARDICLFIGNTIATLTIIVFLGWFLFRFYKAWECIQVEGVTLSPAKVVGCLLIPGFNFYWVFVVFPGLVKQCNRLIEQYAIPAPKLSTTIAFVTAFFYISGTLGIITGTPISLLGTAILSYAYYRRMEKTLNAVYQWRTQLPAA
ncbi:MAG: hypothetical protein HQK55_16020 [Deltaproteobacteria bacterium]|nr:hypothetical protein [Deltaproteobacteria bacterium]